MIFTHFTFQMPIIYYLHLCTFTPLKISIRTADETSTKLPVTV